MTTHNNNRLLVIAAGLLALLGPVSTAVAQEWIFDPIIRAGWELDDNAVLSIRTDEEVKITGWNADASAEIGYNSETTDFSLTPRVRFRRYDDETFDSTDLFTRLNYRYLTRSSIFRIRGSFERESVRTAERSEVQSEITDPDDLTNDDTGLVQFGGDRERWQFRPSYTYRINDISSISLNLSYMDVSYTDQVADVLSDFTDKLAEISYGRKVTPVTDLIFLMSGRQFRNDEDVNEFDGFKMMGGIRRQLTEKTELTALVGGEVAEFDSDRETASEFAADIRLIRRLETITVMAQYKRGITADGGWLPTARQNFTLNFSRRLSEKITVGIGARLWSTEQVSSGAGSSRDYTELRAGLGWHLTPTFDFRFEVRHRNIDRGDLIGEKADSNQVGIWFVYRPRSPQMEFVQ